MRVACGGHFLINIHYIDSPYNNACIFRMGDFPIQKSAVMNRITQSFNINAIVVNEAKYIFCRIFSPKYIE